MARRAVEWPRSVAVAVSEGGGGEEVEQGGCGNEWLLCRRQAVAEVLWPRHSGVPKDGQQGAQLVSWGELLCTASEYESRTVPLVLVYFEHQGKPWHDHAGKCSNIYSKAGIMR